MNISPREIVKSNNDEANHLNFLKKKKEKKKRVPQSRNILTSIQEFSKIARDINYYINYHNYSGLSR